MWGISDMWRILDFLLYNVFILVLSVQLKPSMVFQSAQI